MQWIRKTKRFPLISVGYIRAEREAGATAVFTFAARWEKVLRIEAGKLRCTCQPPAKSPDEEQHVGLDCPVGKLLQMARLIAGEGEEAKAKVFGLQGVVVDGETW